MHAIEEKSEPLQLLPQQCLLIPTCQMSPLYTLCFGMSCHVLVSDMLGLSKCVIYVFKGLQFGSSVGKNYWVRPQKKILHVVG